jgi:Tlde1 domain
MTDATAAFHRSSYLDGRSPLGRCRRVFRSIARGIGIGLGAAAAAGALVTTGTLTAAWMLETARATNPNLNGMRSGPAAIALADPDLAFAGVADITGSTTVVAEQAPIEPASVEPASANAAADPADALAFATRWAGGTFQAAMPAATEPLVATEPLAPPSPAEPGFKLASLASPGQTVPPLATPAPAKPAAPLQAHNKSTPLLPEPDGHTAVYDIAAHTVYLPNGTKLEAHSGLGDKLDDPRYVNLRDRGPTPPNVYDLTLREQRFHEVRAIRLNPVGADNMFGRDGILAHTYMLGANGQSNGCVSFKDYPAFLHAYLRGEIDRLVVVPRLGNTSWRTASARGTGRYADNNP